MTTNCFIVKTQIFSVMYFSYYGCDDIMDEREKDTLSKTFITVRFAVYENGGVDVLITLIEQL